jgi:hypothetical protein
MIRPIGATGFVVAIGLVLPACHQQSGPPQFGGPPADSGFGSLDAGQPLADAGSMAWADAGIPLPPQVLFGTNGVILASPEVVPIFFTNDDSTTPGETMSFLNALAVSSYWPATTEEYGVGSLTIHAAVTDGAASSMGGGQIVGWLENEISAQRIPAPGSGTIYVLHFPTGIDVGQGGGASCLNFAGYHADDMLSDGTPLAYAVLPRCSSADTGLPNDFEVLATSEVHEIVECATDPFPDFNPAWYQVDNGHLYWDIVFGGSEIADMCENDPEAYVQAPDIGHYVQRIWSNAQALGGHDPCRPGLQGEVYFNTVPELPDAIVVDDNGTTGTSFGINIPLNQSKTITVDFFADGDTSGPWNVQAQDVNVWNGGTPTMHFSPDSFTGQNGDRVQLTITPTTRGQGGQDYFVLTSTNGNMEQHLWFGLVGGE